MSEPPSSPPSDSASAEDALAWYKSQYEQLEHELAEFRESSRELEQELERDIEQAEKRERAFQEKAESVGFEVEEWKRKYKESKSEAASAQNILEKEITTLRDANRTLQLKLRDTEVANDDFERQARNTTSSLEDLESKYNIAIERGVMMEEEIKIGEQEREQLRIEAQRLREELADLKIEAELLQDKVRKHETARHHLSHISTDVSVLESPTFDKHTAADDSPGSTASSPLITTPPEAKALAAVELGAPQGPRDPPSPPMSDASVPLPKVAAAAARGPPKTPAPVGAPPRKSRLPSADQSVTPKPKFTASTSKRPPGARVATVTPATRTPAPRTTTAPRSTSHKLPPQSNSLSHIRSLTAQMQRLEARVQSARSKLPAPVSTPPRSSPRSSLHGAHNVPSSVTIRSRKRGTTTTGRSSIGTPSVQGDDTTPTNARAAGVAAATTKHVPRLSTSGVSRLSFGPLPNRGHPAGDSDASLSRPSSRASMSSGIARPVSRTDMIPPPRPISRASLSGARTPLGRPHSSLGGSLHGHSVSLSGSLRGGGPPLADFDDDSTEFRTPSRRGTYSRLEMEGLVASGIPAPASGIPMPSSRRQSGGGAAVGRRTSSGASLGLPPRPPTRNLDEIGETY